LKLFRFRLVWLRNNISETAVGKKNRKHIFFIAVCAFLVLSSLALWLISEPSYSFGTNLEDLIRKELIHVDPQPSTNMVDAIYVLGGSQSSLKFKFKTAASLYHDGISNKIMILSRPGKTEYSSLLGRNLTNDEWAIRRLNELDIPRNSVEPISIEKGFFGTLREAKGISRLIKKRGYKSIVLISSPYHTHRVRISFGKFLKEHNVAFCVQGSGEKASIRQLIVEYIKLKIYQYMLVSSEK